MCFYDQYVYECSYWKWGNFRQHCQGEYRTGDTCGMKMVYRSVALSSKCKTCLRIEAKERSMAKLVADYNRWRTKPERYGQAMEKAISDIKVLRVDTDRLKSQKHGYQNRKSNPRRTGASSPETSMPSPKMPMNSTSAGLDCTPSHPNVPFQVYNSLRMDRSEALEAPNNTPATQHETPSRNSSRHEFYGQRDSYQPRLRGGRDDDIRKRNRAFQPDITQHTLSMKRAAEAVFCTEKLKVILAAALVDLDIGAERLYVEALRLVMMLAKGVEIEARVRGHLDVSRDLGTTNLASYAAHRAVQHAQKARSELLRRQGVGIIGNVSDEASASFFADGDLQGPSEKYYRNVHDFLFNSDAYGILEIDLLEFAHQPYKERIISAIGNDLVGSSGEDLDQSAAEAVAQEISWVPTNLLTISHDTTLSYSNEIKESVEHVVQETWNWWPLAPRLHRLRPGYCRLYWKSVRMLNSSFTVTVAVLIAHPSHAVSLVMWIFHVQPRTLYSKL